MPSLSHQTESFERLNNALGLANGTPLSDRIALGSPRSANSRSKPVMATSSRVVSRASQSTRGMISNGQRVTPRPIPKLELPLVVGAPQIIGGSALRQRRSVGTAAPFGDASHKIM